MEFAWYLKWYLTEVFAAGHCVMEQCANPVSRHEGKKSNSQFSNNFVNILCVFLNVICILFMESLLVNQNQQQSFQSFLVAVTLVKISRTFKDFKNEIQGLSRNWPIVFKDFAGLENERKIQGPMGTLCTQKGVPCGINRKSLNYAWKQLQWSMCWGVWSLLLHAVNDDWIISFAVYATAETLDYFSMCRTNPNNCALPREISTCI